MTDKVQKIREEVEKLRIKNTEAFDCGCDGTKCAGYDMACDDILSFIDSMQEEPVSVWHDASEKPIKGKIILVVQDNGFPFVCDVRNDIGYVSLSFDHSNKTKIDGKDKWAYIDDILKLSNVERTEKDRKEPVSEKKCMFTNDSYSDEERKVLCEDCKEKCEYSKKEEPISQDLEEAADKYSNNDYNYFDVLVTEYDGTEHLMDDKVFVKDAFKAGAKWGKNHLWKPADGDDLPEIDREVIALVAYDFGHYKVVYAHRPNTNGWDGKNLITGKVEHYTPKTYGKGGWNIQDVKYWLDVELPKEIEL